MKKAVILCTFVSLLASAASGLQAAPLSVNILDHDFTYHVPYARNPDTQVISSAVYDYNGAAPDVLRLTNPQLPGEGPAGWHNVPSYGYSGVVPQVPPGPGFSTPPAASTWLYPTFFTQQFGARLEIEMHFDANDGPYVNPSGDLLDISLTGKTGFLRITGWIGTQGLPTGILYPDPKPDGSPNDVVLLEIAFNQVSLLARAGHSTADLIEGVGDITTLMGYSIQELEQMPEFAELGLELDGVTFSKFMLPDENMQLFPLLAASQYDPLVAYPGFEERVFGVLSGEAGVGVPEPGSMMLIAVGSIGLLIRRRRAR